MRLWLLTIILALLLMNGPGCEPVDQSVSASPPAARVCLDDWVGIAGVGGTDAITLMHIDGLLTYHGIECFSEGSLVYGIFVRKNDVARAEQILHDDAMQRRYWIMFSNGEQITGREMDWTEDVQRRPYSEVLRLPAYPPTSDLGGLLRCNDVAAMVQKYPIVCNIRHRKRVYIPPLQNRQDAVPDRVASPATEVGYEAQIELGDRGDAGVSMYFQVWNGGKSILRLGSNEWGRLPETE